MPIPQVPRPSFSLVLNSGLGSAVVKDYQRAQNRDVQLPIYGPVNPVTETIDPHHSFGILTYKCDYISGCGSMEIPAQDDCSGSESRESSEEPALIVNYSLWSRLKALFLVIRLFGKKLPHGA